MEKELRPFWSRMLGFNWKLGLLLVFFICVPRFFLVLNANETANYRFIGLIMVVSALAPFVFLSKAGRQVIGLTKPTNYAWLVGSFGLGLAASVLLYLVGDALYQNTFSNWYVYIAKSYSIPKVLDPSDRNAMFMIMAIVAMTFSPIGEELFFRGIVHASFAKSLGNRQAAVFDGLAFALTHMAHFGFIYQGGKWTLLFVPTILWVSSMFLISVLFYWCRLRAGSLLGAIISHSAFNLGMTYCIFYLIR